MGDLLTLLKDPATRDIVGFILSLYLIRLIDRRLHRITLEMAKLTGVIQTSVAEQANGIQENRNVILALIKRADGPFTDKSWQGGGDDAGDSRRVPRSRERPIHQRRQGAGNGERQATDDNGGWDSD